MRKERKPRKLKKAEKKARKLDVVYISSMWDANCDREPLTEEDVYIYDILKTEENLFDEGNG